MHLRARHLPLLAVLASTATARLAADPAPGAPRAAVVAELGEPAGRLAIGDHEELRYARGGVVLDKGVVTTTTLISPGEWELRERARLAAEKAKVETQARDAAALAERRAKANAALAELVINPRWKDLTGEGRIETLARFAKVFPDADLAGTEKEAGRKRDLELAEKRRLSALETRVANAEARADEAEARARGAESRAADAGEARARGAESRAADAGEAARRAEAAAAQARRNDDFYGVRAYNVLGGGRIDGAYPDYYYRPRSSAVTVSNGVIVVTTGNVPPGVTPRPIVITRPATPAPAPTTPQVKK